jgi:hypothetical protein
MTFADMVLGEQYIAGSNYKRLTVRSGKLERTGESDYELGLRIRVPVVR